MRATTAVLAIAASLLAIPVAAQSGSISGRVTNRGTGAPLAGVTVQLKGTTYGSSTRANGEYTILGVNPGTYTVVARGAGYQLTEITNVAVASGVVRRQNIELSALQGAALAESQRYSRAVITQPFRADSVRYEEARLTYVASAVGADRSFERSLFPPELVMQHQAALAITADQRRAITDAVKALQNRSVDLQWNLQGEEAALTALLERRPVPEAAVIAQLNTLLELEAEVKRAHLAALVRIKNSLTDEQVERLTALRAGAGARR